MILHTTDIIRFRFINNLYKLQNKTYKVYIKNSTDWKQIYNGLTYFNFNGYSDIYLDTILRDLVFRWETEWYDDQLFRPINYTDNINKVNNPIESQNNAFMTTNVKVVVNDTMEQIKAVSGCYFPFYEKPQKEILNPYDDTITQGAFQNLSTLAKSTPHIPNIVSDNFWLGLNFSTNGAYTAPLFLKTPSGRFEIKKSGYGNYAIAYSLKTLKESLGYGDGNTSILMANNPNVVGKGDTLVAVVDGKCEMANYYVAFNYNYGWSCMGFDGNVYENIETDNIEIENDFNITDTIWNKTKTRFNLYTQLLTESDYKTLMGLLSSYKIYVFDVKNDKGSWCSLTTKSKEGLANIRKKPKYFNIELVENKYQIA